MYTTFEFYRDVYYGNKLEEKDFNKVIPKAESIIARYTFDNVTEAKINRYPKELIEKIKRCACELSDFCNDVDKVNSEILSNNNGGLGLIKSKKAGEVTVSYSTSNFLTSYIRPNNIKVKYKSILNDYLYPQCIGGKFYNLLSWVTNSVCNKNNII